MTRGTIVKNKEEECFILLSIRDNVANCAVVEDVLDEFEGYSSARVTALRKIPTNEIYIAEKYPHYFNQISIS